MGWWKSIVKFVAPVAIRGAFWGTVAYVGPLALVSVTGPVPLITTAVVINLGGIEFLLLLI